MCIEIVASRTLDNVWLFCEINKINFNILTFKYYVQWLLTVYQVRPRGMSLHNFMASDKHSSLLGGGHSSVGQSAPTICGHLSFFNLYYCNLYWIKKRTNEKQAGICPYFNKQFRTCKNSWPLIEYLKLCFFNRSPIADNFCQH